MTPLGCPDISEHTAKFHVCLSWPSWAPPAAPRRLPQRRGAGSWCCRDALASLAGDSVPPSEGRHAGPAQLPTQATTESGNLKTTVERGRCPAPAGAAVAVRIGGMEREAVVSDGSFAVATGQPALAPASKGWIGRRPHAGEQSVTGWSRERISTAHPLVEIVSVWATCAPASRLRRSGGRQQ